MNPEELVTSGYDRVADQYLATKKSDDPITIAALESLALHVPAGGRVLDLGCGAGVPATQWLAQRFSVTGVDVSAQQLELARSRVPAAALIQGSMTELDFPPKGFNAVVALHSIIHVPRSEQPALVERIHGWLVPGGAFLATWALEAWEGSEENWEGWGAPMWWSHHDADTNLRMLQTAGFRIESAQTLGDEEETWLWVLALRWPQHGCRSNPTHV